MSLVKGTDRNVTWGKYQGYKGRFFLRKASFFWDLYFLPDGDRFCPVPIDWTFSLCLSDALIDKYNDYKRLVQEGMVYIGEVMTTTDGVRLPHGFGAAKLSNGWKYTGEWEEGQMHGKGTLRNCFEDREYFSGQWKLGKPVLHIEDDATCPICLENPSSADAESLFPCKHVFCSRCVGQWLKLQGKCPICFKVPTTIPSFSQPIPQPYVTQPPTLTPLEEEKPSVGLKQSQLLPQQ